MLNNRQVLKFEATDKFLAGVYECVAANGVGIPATASVELNIICKMFYFEKYNELKSHNI